MSEGERRIADTRGRVAEPVQGGSRVDDAGWSAGRILLSNKRLVVATEDDKRTIPLSRIEGIGGRFDVNQSIARVSGYVSLRLGERVVLIAPEDPERFEHDLYSALLNGTVLLARHPAVKGGVVQETDWEKARIKLTEESVNVVTEGGELVEIELDDIGAVETAERTVRDRSRTVVEVEYTIEATSVRTYFSGPDRSCSFLEALFESGEEENVADLDLDSSEKQVLMALYSGVSPFEIPEFTGMDVETVEGTYERLIELDVLEEVRKRREVTLTTRGRNVASEAINEE